MRLVPPHLRLPAKDLISAVLACVGRHERLAISAASRVLALSLFIGLCALAPRPIAMPLQDQSNAALAVVAVTIEQPPADEAAIRPRLSPRARARGAHADSSALELWIDVSGSRRFETYAAYRAYRRCLDETDPSRQRDEETCYTRP